MSQSIYNYWLLENRDISRKLTKVAQKCHHVEKTHEFLNKCYGAKILPNFTKLKKQTIQNGRLKPSYVLNIRLENLKNELEATERKMKNLKFQYEYLIKEVEKNVSSRLFQKIIYFLEKTVAKRERKFKVFNNSGVKVPRKVVQILENGLDFCIGGIPRDTDIYAAHENFFTTSKYFKIRHYGSKRENSVRLLRFQKMFYNF